MFKLKASFRFIVDDRFRMSNVFLRAREKTTLVNQLISHLSNFKISTCSGRFDLQTKSKYCHNPMMVDVSTISAVVCADSAASRNHRNSIESMMSASATSNLKHHLIYKVPLSKTEFPSFLLPRALFLLNNLNLKNQILISPTSSTAPW